MKERQVRERKELEVKATPGRCGVKCKQSNLAQSMPKQKQNRDGEKEEAVCQIEEAGLGQYCSVLEF
jgi:hypothetical protein